MSAAYLAGMATFLTRRVLFSAAHRYRIAEWSAERNEATFGLCARPSYHGHSYVCDVTVTGEVDPITGFLVDLPRLDEALRTEVRERFDHRGIAAFGGEVIERHRGGDFECSYFTQRRL